MITLSVRDPEEPLSSMTAAAAAALWAEEEELDEWWCLDGAAADADPDVFGQVR